VSPPVAFGHLTTMTDPLLWPVRKQHPLRFFTRNVVLAPGERRCRLSAAAPGHVYVAGGAGAAQFLRGQVAPLAASGARTHSFVRRSASQRSFASEWHTEPRGAQGPPEVLSATTFRPTRAASVPRAATRVSQAAGARPSGWVPSIRSVHPARLRPHRGLWYSGPQ